MSIEITLNLRKISQRQHNNPAAPERIQVIVELQSLSASGKRERRAHRYRELGELC